jgi:hypothetical protein
MTRAQSKTEKRAGVREDTGRCLPVVAHLVRQTLKAHH